MANTNLNTDAKYLSTDIYEIVDFLDQIRANNVTDLDETASIVGIFGYMNEMFSQTLQNTLITVSETSNETIPIKAKFTKNIIAHAMNFGVTKIMAHPAVMTMMIFLPVNFIEMNFTELDYTSGKAKFVLCRDVPINIDNHEFHLDYDIIFTRIKNPQGKYVYTAMYDLFNEGTTDIKQSNPISEITNPYITTIVQYKIDGVDYVAFSARLHQVSFYTIEKNILTGNSIENKTVTFDFRDQLAAFDVDIIENNKTTHLTPIYNGLLDYTVEDGTWCYYEYINENTIRIMFDRDSYVPGMNSIVRINVQITEGFSGNFTYNNQFRTALHSEEYNNYNGMYAIVTPLQNGLSTNGRDKKSIKELKRIIPREAQSRGAIINTTDLHNFFNSIDDLNCKLYFKKKRDNPFERLYYAYILMRKNASVYPTNTLSLRLLQSDFIGYAGNNNLSINPGTIFYYYDHGNNDKENDFATIVPPVYCTKPERYEDEDFNMTINADGETVRVFEYISPFLITVDDDLISSYLLTCMKEYKTFEFASINTASNLQFVATNMLWQRKFIYEDDQGNPHTYDDKYTMDITMTQNDNSQYNLIKYHLDPNGDMVFDDIRIKMIMVLYADDTDKNPYRYLEAELVEYIENNFIYTFRFTFPSDDLMDLTNRINIKGIYNCKPEEFQHKDSLETSHGYMYKNTYAKLFILADFGTKVGDEVNGNIITDESAEIILYGEDGIGNRTELESIVPKRDDIVDEFLKNEIYCEKNGELVNVVTIMKYNPLYIEKVKEYNGDEQETEVAILRYLRNNRDSDFVQNTLLKDPDTELVIDSYNFEDYSRYTVCNTLTVEDGIDFYHDYSNMMRSVVNVEQLQKTDASGNLLYKEIQHTDSMGNNYTEYKPIYEVNENGVFFYQYTLDRLPMIKNFYLNTEELMQDFIDDLEERRKYINECLYVLEDTFDIDLKFFCTFGPSRMFYYNIPSSEVYNVRVGVVECKVLSSTSDEDNPEFLAGMLKFGQEVTITKVKGQWGYIVSPYQGWIKLSQTTRLTSYIDNVALKLKFAIQAQTSADKYITTSIVNDVKEYIEDINQITELHVPNIITLITNNYREQLVYFEFLDVNNYGAACQHLYLDEQISADIRPEFLNVAASEDGLETPLIDIIVY